MSKCNKKIKLKDLARNSVVVGMVDLPTPEAVLGSIEESTPNTTPFEHSKDHPLWLEFEQYARDNGISLEYQDDWDAWWHCYKSGAAAGANATIRHISSSL